MSAAILKEDVVQSGLFDPEYYSEKYEDIKGSGVDPLSHFVEHGIDEGRRPSLAFDPELYKATNPDVAESGENAFVHYLREGRSQGRHLHGDDIKITDAIAASGLFDPRFYCAYYPDAIESGLDPLYHFFRYGLPERRRPSIEFDTLGYLDLYRDVAAHTPKALEHYVLYGRGEGRTLPPTVFDREGFWEAYALLGESGLFDAEFYRARNPVVRASRVDPLVHYLVEGNDTYLDPNAAFSAAVYFVHHPHLFSSRENALLHYLRNGGKRGEAVPGRGRTGIEDDARAAAFPDRSLARARMEASSYFARYGFAFAPSSSLTHLSAAAEALATAETTCRIDTRNPDVSIIIPVYGQTHFALSCLDSLAHHASRYSVEIIVADDRSPAEHRSDIIETIPWVSYARNEKNCGFLDNCNLHAEGAKGTFLVLLNSDTRVVDGWLDELIGAFTVFPRAGFVGSKLINGDGTLQEAGGLYWADGTAWNYGRGADQRDPRYSFARQVDWVSGASIAVPRSIWTEVGGFDPAFRPAYCEDVDLAFRIRERGYEVWYQPLSCALHFEGMTHGRDETAGVKAYQVTNLKRLQQRWQARLPGYRTNGVEPEREANRSAKQSMLVIDALTHTPDRDAGSAIGWQMLKAFRELGFQQTFFPLHGPRHEGRYTEDYQRVGVEMLYGPFVTNFETFVRGRNEFDYVLTHRYNVTQDVIGLIRRYMPMARILFVPADLHHLRMAREAELKRDRSMRIKAARARTEELQVFAEADCSMPHTPVEKDIVRGQLPHRADNIVVLPWTIEIAGPTPGQDERHDIMYLGGYNHTPNVDAVEFFVRDVLPKIADDLPERATFLVVGNAPPARLAALASERIVVTGHVLDVAPYFARARVFVAPLRFGAGIKGKVIQSLAHGVPVVATGIAMEGIGLVHEDHCLQADTPEAIAEAVLRLYREPDTWTRLREAGLRFVEETFSWKATLSICERALDVADATWIAREDKRFQDWAKDHGGDVAGPHPGT